MPTAIFPACLNTAQQAAQPNYLTTASPTWNKWTLIIFVFPFSTSSIPCPFFPIHLVILCFCKPSLPPFSHSVHRGPAGKSERVLDTTANPLIHPPTSDSRAWLHWANTLLSEPVSGFLVDVFSVFDEQNISTRMYKSRSTIISYHTYLKPVTWHVRITGCTDSTPYTEILISLSGNFCANIVHLENWNYWCVFAK